MNSKKKEKHVSSLLDMFNTNSLDTSNIRTFREILEEQIKIESFYKKPPKELEKKESWSDSDEELKAELKMAMSRYSKPEKVTETQNSRLETKDSRPKTETLSHENSEIPLSKNSNGYKNSDTTSNEKLHKTFEANRNKDDVEDIQNLINYFFLPTKLKSDNLKPKNYSEYEKQGAIPKHRTFSLSEDVKKAEKPKKRQKKKKEIHSLELSIENPFLKESANTLNSDSEIEKASEEICRKPFYYIVPENPSPKFFLPCGSYLVCLKNPNPDDIVIFHPEKGEEKIFNHQTSRKQVHDNLNNPNSRSANDLGKAATQKMDSHLNIGPSDIKLTDFIGNLEKSYSPHKTYDKAMVNKEGEKGPGGEGEESVCVLVHEREELEDAAVVSKHENNKELDQIIQRLMSAFSDFSPDYCVSVASEFLKDKPGLENFIATESLTRKIQNQLPKLMEVFPDYSVAELREKCEEFQGDEQLLENYIQEQMHLRKISQLVTDLLVMFPDADPDFLISNVERLNGNAKEVSIFSEDLLETNNYPKISDDECARDRRILWKAYVTDFNVKNYILKVPSPQDYEDGRNGKKMEKELVLKFLMSRYPFETNIRFMDVFINNDRNLTKTCTYLSDRFDSVKLIESSFQNEAFDEEFLKEICYIENKEKIDNYLREIRNLKMVEKEDARLNGGFLSCPLCADDELIPSEAVTCPEGHVFCAECIKTLIQLKFAEGVYKYICPMGECKTSFTLATLTSLFPENVIKKIIKKQQAEEVSTAKVDGLEMCSYCDFAYIPNPEDKIFKCQNSDCLMEICRKCKEVSHIPLRCEEIENSTDLKARKAIEEAMTERLVRTCPTCQKKFVRSDGCNKMVCTCGTVVCYNCREKVDGYSHFEGRGGSCPLYTANEVLHGRTVLDAGIATRDSLLQENPNIKLLHDPTKDF